MTDQVDSPSQETRLRVRYAETDQMGVVYHANYYVWMEIGRVEYVRSRGLNYKDLERDGYFLAVVETQCRHLAPARYDQEIIVRTSMGLANAKLVEFHYEIRCVDSDKPLAKGTTRHMWLDREWRRTKLPEQYARLLMDAQAG